MRVWAVADSDSYLKWSAATLAAFPSEWERRLVLLASPVQPSPGQVRAAVGHDVPPRSLARLLLGLVRDRPDVLVLGCTGPAVAALTSLPPVRDRRIVLVTGLPGQSLPASRRAVASRAACDVLVVHTRRERTAFTAVAAETAPGLRIGLARLPFLVEPGQTAPGTDVVFAPQALVPPDPADRKQILRALAAIEPPGTAVIKVRAVSGEQQTHREAHPYAGLWDQLVADGDVAPGAVRFVDGSMADALTSARALVTVSSTAALEAMSRGVPVAILMDFGVSDALLNAVFADSGCLATLADVRAGRFATADPGWMADNGFHPPAESDWLSLVAERVGSEHRSLAGSEHASPQRVAPPPAGGRPVLGPRRRRPRLGAATVIRALLRLVVPAGAVRRWRSRRLSDPDPR